ncbi:MAG TPA: hypothetical protein DGT23_00705, partial [Micromonosporaceae bacterium]|nr:hypothetical protein [Micromonosporaceae bacterium]
AGVDDVGPDHWTRGTDVLDALRIRTSGAAGRDLGVDLSNSRCTLRLPRRDVEEPVGHRFGWYWYDWCQVMDVDPLRVIDACVSVVDAGPELFGALPAHLAIEVWAAGYLLGHDAAGTVTGAAAGTFAGAAPPRNGQQWRDRALEGWVTQGIAQADERKLTDAAGPALAALVGRGLARGWSDRSTTDRVGRG